MTAAPQPAAELLLARRLDEAAAAYAAGRLDEAARLYRRLERDHPRDIRAPYSLAVIDLRRGGHAGARRRLVRVVRLQPGLFAAWRNLAVASQSLGLWTEAAEAFEAAHALSPADAETAFLRAAALAAVGRGAEAIAAWRALAAQPAHRLRAIARIAFLDPAVVTDAEAVALRAGADDPTASEADGAAALFALGEALDARGEPDPAFAAFAAGNHRKRRALAADPATDPAVVAADHACAAQAVRARFSADALSHHGGLGERAQAPIFIVGMPRSGSTLIEQILAGHPKITALGETGVLPALLEASPLYDPNTPLSAEALKAPRDLYLAALGERGWKGRGRFTDKTLENHLHLGAIALMFPGATIIHAVRDPVATGFACWRQLFASGNETLYDLAEIGAAYVTYRALMDHWRAVLPGRIVEAPYEALVADPQAEARRLVEACGLAWDPRCLAFHETQRPVATASAGQVRRPIYTTSLARWRRHEAELAPLINALGPYAPRA